ncbi:tyrosine-type recombinase/integrase [Haloglomus salinum]|uniref:tyrosine-type recombinase/integrase n=1 Tax=Haloglomus salinum TaxID=2962673 RepID=UPI0020C9CC52|nr:site-specific integrase [Haloglomus salinum]
MTDTIQDIPICPPQTAQLLTERERIDYTGHRRDLLEWMLTRGKDPEMAEGYAQTTVENRARYQDGFYRWVWNDRGYTTQITADDCDQYIQELLLADHSRSYVENIAKTLQMLTRWHRTADEWEPDFTFSGAQQPQQPRDYLTREERRAVREAALHLGSVPHYNALSPEERDVWKVHLARRFDKPAGHVGPDDFDRANGHKLPSLVWTSLDAGLRPIEVARARTSWVDVSNAVLRIPAEDSSKNTDNWRVSVRTETAEFLAAWLDERSLYPKYDDTDQLWLTRHNNPYESHALAYVMDNLCEEAEIDRDLSWYAIRHSVGTYMTREEGLAAAQAQLRHQSPRTTMKYDQTPVEDRRDALDRMG